MGPDLEKSQAANEVLARKDNAIVNPNEADDLVQCMSNYEDNNFHEEVTSVNDGLPDLPAKTGDMNVNIIRCTNSDENVEIEEGNFGDCTESTSMSSFGDTLSENENGSVQDDMEVESKLRFDGVLNPPWAFDDTSGEFPVRRKKLTDHWRRFIRPLMWRCKWLELRIKEIQSQAQKYDKKLAEYGERRVLDSIEGVETKSLPFSSHTRREKIMKRKKRKRVEETTDMASYMLHHNLFSYYENKKSAAGRVLMDDDCGNLDKAVNATDEFELQEEWLSFDFKGDSINENSLRKIELLQSQVRKLKARIGKVERENPGKFRLTMPETDDEMLTESDQDHESQDQTTVKSKTTGDVLPESAVSSHGEIPVSDLVESTSQPQTREEEIPKDKAVVKEEPRDLTSHGIQLVENPLCGDEMPIDTLPARVNFGGKTLPKHRINITYSKRNRTKRTSAKAGWNSKR